MVVKTVSPAKSKSPGKSSQKYFEQRFKKESTDGVYRKRVKQVEEPKTSKTALICMGLFFLMFMSSTIYSFARSKTTTSSAPPKRPQVAGLDIPREVMEKVQRLTNAQEREAVVMDWAQSVGIEFENRKDGSYIATRDGQEYVIRDADPDYVPEEDISEDTSENDIITEVDYEEHQEDINNE
ncbi:hypothetical protein SS50377_26730 [Spironucleus salmonicida]|uniref:Uncharacterized protein n=1 Tax=Spironucleus salmonicida TaxID=348837 RepID=V6LZN4_9EUKA|nr:hypothetical protein SS50377_26730 [Spironucleus salmonicida]|eukprot:EST49201.1 Hypothetical protein SS50377_10418 [Spironucleus salmonicida]